MVQEYPMLRITFLSQAWGLTKSKSIGMIRRMTEIGFEIYRATIPGGPYTLITTPTTPATIKANNPQGFTSIGLTPNTTYYYRMRAVNDNGGSTYTPEKSAKTDADLIPPTPPILSVVSTNRNSISLSWAGATDNVGIAQYKIYQNGSSCCNCRWFIIHYIHLQDYRH